MNYWLTCIIPIINKEIQHTMSIAEHECMYYYKVCLMFVRLRRLAYGLQRNVKHAAIHTFRVQRSQSPQTDFPLYARSMCIFADGISIHLSYLMQNVYFNKIHFTTVVCMCVRFCTFITFLLGIIVFCLCLQTDFIRVLQN